MGSETPDTAGEQEQGRATTRLLILGAPRSGTTLLASMVGAHPDVALSVEVYGVGYERIVSKKVVGNKLCIPNQIELDRKFNIAQRLGLLPWMERLGLAGWLLRRRWLTRFYDASPYSIRSLLKRGPTKLILLVREGADVVGSIMRRGNQPLRTAVFRWSRAIDIISRLHEEDPAQSLIVRFEELVRDAEGRMRAICRFLDLPFDARMLDGYRFNPIYPGRSGIDSSRAHASRSGGTEFDLPRRVPGSYERYRQLVLLAGGPPDRGESAG